MKVQLEVKKIILGWYLKNKNEILFLRCEACQDSEVKRESLKEKLKSLNEKRVENWREKNVWTVYQRYA